MEFSIVSAYEGHNENSGEQSGGRKNERIEARKIKNGWIIHRSWSEEHSGKDECCGDSYKYEEEYSPTNPFEIKKENQ